MYGIDKTAGSDSNDPIFFDIMQCVTPVAVEQKIKDYLSSVQGRLNKVDGQEPKAELGFDIWQGHSSVCLVQDSVFVNISGKDVSVLSGAHPSLVTKKLPL